MRIALSLAATALVSALLTYLWMDSRREPPAPEPAAVDRPPTVIAPQAPTLQGRSVPSPDLGPASIADDDAETATVNQRLADHFHTAAREFSRKLQEKDVRIRELEAEIARLKTTLPRPELLHALDQASVEDLTLMAGAIRKTTGERLLTPPQHVKDRWSSFLTYEDSGASRILIRGKHDHVVEQRGGGAYWSFVTRSNSYDDEPDLQLSGGLYSTSFYGGTSGYLMDLGPLAIEQVDADANRPPSGLDALQLRQWAWMWTPATKPDRGGRLDVRAEGGNPKLTDRAAAHVGHTYLLRAILPDEHDILVVFHAAEADDHGHTLVWRILKKWEIQ